MRSNNFPNSNFSSWRTGINLNSFEKAKPLKSSSMDMVGLGVFVIRRHRVVCYMVA
jgi:hypothetical protein